MVEDIMQNLDYVTCGIFQIYFLWQFVYTQPKQQNTKQKKTKQKNNRNFTERTVCFWTTKNKVKRQLTTTLTTVTSRSHESPVPEPTISYLLGIVDFGQARKKWSQKK